MTPEADTNSVDTLRIGSVPFPNNYRVRAQIEELESRFPHAKNHHASFLQLGCRFTYAGPIKEPLQFEGVWLVLLRLSEGMQKRFGIHTEVPILYSPHHDVQARLPQALPSILSQVGDRQVTKWICYLNANTPRLVASVDNITRAMTTTFIPLPPLPDPESGREIFQITAQRVAQAELYDITNPVEGDQFFGRDQLLTNLETCVNSGSAFGLFGMRKTGKTSVVNMLRQKLEKTAELEREQLVCDADLEGLPAIQDLKIGQLVAEVAKGIKLAARRKGLRVEELSNLSAQPTINEFDNALRHLLQSRSYKGVSVLLVLDEVEHICSPEAPHIVGSETERKVVEFLGVLRKISKDYSQSEYQGSNFGSFNLGFVGLANAIIEEHTLYGRENPLFRFARTFYLEPLSLEESASLLNQIGSRRGLIWDSEAVRQAAQVSGGNVTLLRTLAALPESECIDPVLKLSGVDQ